MSEYGIQETMVAVFEGHCPNCDRDDTVKITDVGGTQEFVDATGLLPGDVKVMIWKPNSTRDVQGGVTAMCEACRRVYYVEQYAETGDWA